MNAIEAHNISKSFQTRRGIPVYSSFGDAHWLTSLILKGASKLQYFQAVDDLSLNIQPGEFVALLGPNGAGKTTLLKCLSTLLIPERGEAKICGHDIRRDIDAVKRSISLVGSGSWIGFDWGLTVFENLLFFASLYGMKNSFAKKRIGEVQDMVGISAHANSVPRILSAGQRQKMALAKGFLLHAPIFLLDEPTVALDPISTYEVKKYIREELSQKGVTIILTTHQMQEAEELCSRVVLMNKGKIIADDSVSNLKEKVRGKNVLEVEVSDVPGFIIEEIRVLRGVEAVTLTRGSTESLSAVVRVQLEDQAAGDWVISCLDSRGVKINGYGIADPSLEDVFVKLTGRGLSNGAA